MFLPQRGDRHIDSIPQAYSNHILTSFHSYLHPLPFLIVGRHFLYSCLPYSSIKPVIFIKNFIKNCEIIEILIKIRSK